jgi:SPP1 family predicted phage head-tail adaptor
MSAIIRARDLDRYITIEQVTYTANSINEQVAAWTTFAQVWASKHDLVGREFSLANQAATAVIDTLFRSWWLDGISAAMRISLEGSYWNVHGIAELGRREGVEIRASRVVR